MPNLPPGPYTLEEDSTGWVHVLDGNLKTVAHCRPPQARAVAELLIRAEREADATPIDEAWLNSMGGTVFTAMGLTISFCMDAMERWQAALLQDDDLVELGPLFTRGQFRKLSSSLGIELKEPPPC